MILTAAHKAALMILTAHALLVGMNMFAKLASDFLDPIETSFYRNIFALIPLFIFLIAAGKYDFYKTKRPWAHLGRGLVGNIGLAIIFWAYSLMPMADVTALIFMAPLILTALSVVFLHEKVGIWRWGAVICGFAGVVLIAQPFGGAVNWLGTGEALTGALTIALVGIFLRVLGKTEDAVTTVFYFLICGIVFFGIYMIFNGSFPAPYVWPYLIGAGLCGGIALLLKTQAFRLAEASFLSPLAYTQIVWAGLLGWLVWGDFPTIFVVTGALVIIAANLVVIWREYKHKKAPSSDKLIGP